MIARLRFALLLHVYVDTGVTESPKGIDDCKFTIYIVFNLLLKSRLPERAVWIFLTYQFRVDLFRKLQHYSEMNIDFLDGFVKQCVDAGLSAGGTENLFRQYVNTALLSHPEIRKGASAILDANQNVCSKQAFSSAMHPDLLADIVERVVHEGDGVGAQEFRRYHPEHAELTQSFRKCATSSVDVEQFSRLKLTEKLELLKSL